MGVVGELIRPALFHPRAFRPSDFPKRLIALLLVISITVFVCMPKPTIAAILAGPITNAATGHAYYLLSKSSWPKAESQAVALGGHLATIRDAAENDWAFQTFASYGGVSRPLWIGLTDYEAKGTYRWISGETASYRNWTTSTGDAEYEPNNSRGIEDYCFMWGSGSASVRAGRWNDGDGSVASYAYGLVEVIPGIAAEVFLHLAVEIAWPTQTTNIYQIQWSSTLSSNNWFNLGAPVRGTGGTNYYFDPTRSQDSRFYRVLTLQP